MQSFPVLGELHAGERAESAALDPQQARREVFVALKQLLTRVAARRPLVVCLEDVQWGDPDSARLLAELLLPPDVPPALVVLGHRDGDSPFVTQVKALLAGAETLVGREVAVERLQPADAHALAARCLEVTIDGDTGVGVDPWVGLVARGWTPGSSRTGHRGARTEGEKARGAERPAIGGRRPSRR